MILAWLWLDSKKPTKQQPESSKVLFKVKKMRETVACKSMDWKAYACNWVVYLDCNGVSGDHLSRLTFSVTEGCAVWEISGSKSKPASDPTVTYNINSWEYSRSVWHSALLEVGCCCHLHSLLFLHASLSPITSSCYCLLLPCCCCCCCYYYSLCYFHESETILAPLMQHPQEGALSHSKAL